MVMVAQLVWPGKNEGTRRVRACRGRSFHSGRLMDRAIRLAVEARVAAEQMLTIARICCYDRALNDLPYEANARLIAAAPDLKNGCNALLGLISLILARDDLTPELREVLTNNHRIDEAHNAIVKAESRS
jgi:hypothetical protein